MVEAAPPGEQVADRLFFDGDCHHLSTREERLGKTAVGVQSGQLR